MKTPVGKHPLRYRPTLAGLRRYQARCVPPRRAAAPWPILVFAFGCGAVPLVWAFTPCFVDLGPWAFWWMAALIPVFVLSVAALLVGAVVVGVWRWVRG